MDNRYLYKRILVITAIMLIIALLGTLVQSFYNSKLSSRLTIEITPSGSSIKINGKGAREGINKVKAGTYTIVVSRTGFATESRSITLSNNQSRYIGISLTPSSADTTNWYKIHREDALKGEGITGRNFDDNGQVLKSKFPIIQFLPFIDREYRIDYGKSYLYPNNSEMIAIIITHYSETGKQQAIDWMKFKGFNPDTLEVIYVSKPFSF